MAYATKTKHKEWGVFAQGKDASHVNPGKIYQKDKRFSSTGIVCQAVKDKLFGFLRLEDSSSESKRNVFFHFDRISSGGLMLKKGDKISFSMSKMQSNRGPSVFKGFLKIATFRHPPEVSEYLEKVRSVSSEGSQASNESKLMILTCVETWQCIACCTEQNNVLCFMQVVNMMEQRGQDWRSHLKTVIITIGHSKLIDGRNSALKNFLLQNINYYDVETLENFLMTMLAYVPERRRAIAILVEPLIKVSKGAEIIYKLLLTVSSESASSLTDMTWKNLPLFLMKEELVNKEGGGFSQLQPMKQTGSYSSANEYLEILTRLLREDCFHSLKEGVKKLLDGSLDKRDMAVYSGLRVVGFKISQQMGFCLVLKMGASSKKIVWKKSKRLMFGNLLCLSMSKQFDDAVWATVANREQLDSSQIVFVQLCSELNHFTGLETLQKLFAFQGEIVVAESPTYYRSYAPVLETLQRLRPEDISFKDELVHLFPAEKPDFLNNSATFSPSVLQISDVLLNPKIMHLTDGFLKGKTVFDVSQENAFIECLKHRIGIIQGPPGTGKTFIGVKLALFLLSISSRPEGPILMITYKNHALDEFLKAVIAEGCDNVVRIGGGSEVSSYNLNKIMREEGKSARSQLLQAEEELDDAIQEVKSAFEKVKKCKTFSVESFLSSVSRKQLQQFLAQSPRPVRNLTKLLPLNESGGGLADMDLKSVVEANGNVKAIVEKALDRWLPSASSVLEIHRSIEIVSKLISHGAAVSTVDEFGEEAESDNEEDIASLLNERQIEEDHLALSSEQLCFDSPTDGIQLIDGFLEILKLNPGVSLQNNGNLWKLAESDKFKLIQTMLVRHFNESCEKFNEKLKTFDEKRQMYEERKCQCTAMILKKKDIIAMTATGASIQSALLGQLKPAIVIVEEAAELLEAQLVAALGSWTKQLILIGDHKQLRPHVETFALERDYNMGVSLMERLISNGFSYATLSTQNRMRPEFAELLKDIYPRLESNLQRVGRNMPAKCLSSSVFFWHHEDQETDDRSFYNEKEADRAIKLALFLIQQGISPSKITILSAYQGQTSVIRKRLKATHASDDVITHTIDNYQGDENDFVIVSLVRSNKKGRIGFLESLNRRCVAQSRSRCGLYFIGNFEMLVRSPNWSFLLETLRRKRMIAPALTLVCPMHPQSTKQVVTADDIDLGTFCRIPCHFKLECGHRCSNPCQPPHKHYSCRRSCMVPCERCCQPCQRFCRPQHDHRSCDQIVSRCLPCDHDAAMACNEDVLRFECNIDVDCPLSGCNHIQKRKCFQREKVLACTAPCLKRRGCGHLCTRKCGEDCNVRKCITCIEEQVAKAKALEAQQEAQRKRLVEEEKRILKDLAERKKEEPFLKEIKAEGETAPEFFMVEDRVKRYVQPGHNWFPVVKKVEKVINYELEERWREAKLRMHDPEFKSDLKFHGTGESAIQSIVRDGFRLPKENGMYGKGIYFATDSSKSAQKKYTKGSNKLLLCEVLIGKALVVEKAERNMTLAKMKEGRHDSLFAKRNTREKGGVLFDEFVIYRADQALPRYIVHYEQESATRHIALPAESHKLMKYRLQESRAVDTRDPLEIHYRIAESQFLRLLQRSGMNKQILSIDFFSNPRLEAKFKAKKEAFERNGYPNDCIFAFHGTNEDNVNSIMQNNFRLDLIAKNTGNPGQYGIGIYFSEVPKICFHYGNALMLCQVLPGRCYDVTKEDVKGQPLKQGYDSHGAHKWQDNHYQILVVGNEEQILPCYYIKIKEKE